MTQDSVPNALIADYDLTREVSASHGGMANKIFCLNECAERGCHMMIYSSENWDS